MIANGKIKKLSINNPISVSTLIFFLNKLYKLQTIDKNIPINGTDLKSTINKYNIVSTTIEIDRNLFLLLLRV